MSRLYDGIMGLLVGDALGVPVEFCERDTFEITDMIGYGTHNQPPGTWSDDGSMVLATLESIARTGKIDPEDIMKNFVKWFRQSAFTPHGKVFDIGRTTCDAILNYQRHIPLSECGGRSEWDNGNGSLMRILPLAFVRNHTESDIAAVSALTHGHIISQEACVIYIKTADLLMAGKNFDEVYAMLQYHSSSSLPEFGRLTHLMDLSRDEIRSSGYVVDTLEAALWCLLQTSTYQECILTAVHLGDDTDTTAAVAGGLAGIHYSCGGEKGIPDSWIEQLARRTWIESLCNRVQKRLEC